MIAVPKTMDNDVRNTEYCIGFSTAITRAMDAIERQRTTVGSHERIGFSACSAAMPAIPRSTPPTSPACAAASRNIKVDLEAPDRHCWSTDKRNNPSNYSLVILSEGAEWEGYTVKEYGEPDAFGHRKKMSVAEDLSNEIKHAPATRPSSAT